MDDDFEKPVLSCQPCSEKLPMVLSSWGVEPVIQVPASIAQYLRNYQRDGVRFLYQRYKEGEGGILADDMGLGKTIQAIAFIAAILQMKGTSEDKLRHCTQYIRNEVAPGIEVPSVSPVLVICPASLSDNWVDELQTWGHFSVFKISSANRLDLIGKAKRRECDVLITTFESARSSIDQLNTVEWSCVLVDEVHRIKDTNSQISKALNSLHCNFRFGFTGTPFQNNMEEIWCLLEWSNPKAIRNLSAEAQTDAISRKMEHGHKSSATKREVVAGSAARRRFAQIRMKCMKRRTKEILAEHLPAKTDQIVFCELTDVQKNIYRMIAQSSDVQKLLDSVQDKSCGKTRSLNKSMNKKTGLLFTYLHLLQKTANHVGLLVSGLSPESNETTQKMCLKALENYAGVGGLPQKHWLEALSNVQMSGKMLVLSKILPAFMANNDKILIFSYSTKVLDLIQKHLKRMRYKHWRLDGTTPAEKRFALVKSFNKFPEPAVFLLSTKAGGVGLNITGANVVIIFDPNWNPAHDLQAQDRAYRLGQERDVRVYRLLSTSTIEEFVYLRQVYKQQLGSLTLTDRSGRRYFNSVPKDRRYYGELFGIRNLFSFRESNRSLTEELLEKQQHLEKRLRLKLEAPSRLEASQAQVYISPCAITVNNKDHDGTRAVKSNKSGLTQLCEDIFEGSCEDPFDEESDYDDWSENAKDQITSESESEISCSNISTILERTGAVRHVVEHQEVVAPSTMESFVTNCAVRDVLQKGMNSQLPAFECSVSPEQDDAVVPKHEERPSTSPPDKCRLKFDQIADNELLTPFELATKVMAMSSREKQALLRSHQKGRETISVGDTSARKRARHSLETVVDKISSKTVASEEHLGIVHENKVNGLLKHIEKAGPSKDNVYVNTVRTSRPLVDSPCVKMDDSSETVAETQRNCSGQSESSSSSFEKDASLFCPNLSKDAILLMKGLIDSKAKKTPTKKVNCRDTHKAVSIESTSYVTLSADKTATKPKHNCRENVSVEDHDKLKNRPLDDNNFSPSAVDSETGLSVAAVTFLDSTLFSNTVRKPSPKKAGFMPSTSRLMEPQSERSCTSRTSDLKWDSAFPSKTSKGSHGGSDVGVSCHYEPEDDIFTKLLKSGKLKPV